MRRNQRFETGLLHGSLYYDRPAWRFTLGVFFFFSGGL